jgi:hypothetical protein
MAFYGYRKDPYDSDFLDYKRFVTLPNNPLHQSGNVISIKSAEPIDCDAMFTVEEDKDLSVTVHEVEWKE